MHSHGQRLGSELMQPGYVGAKHMHQVFVVETCQGQPEVRVVSADSRLYSAHWEADTPAVGNCDQGDDLEFEIAAFQRTAFHLLGDDIREPATLRQHVSVFESQPTRVLIRLTPVWKSRHTGRD
ncbi:hypothetical protein GCM10029964_091750 [Kibdelosporangium lantanae]